jgi:CubicO group peptidase (beta-lactamase class C family)
MTSTFQGTTRGRVGAGRIATVALLCALACSDRHAVSARTGDPTSSEDVDADTNCGAGTPSSEDGRTRDLEPCIEAYAETVADAGFAGTLLVAQNGEVIFARGYGLADEAAAVPIARDTAFDTGSLSKQFTAAALLRLAEDGALELEQSLSEFFDDVPADKADITLHQLLTHTSGLVPYAFEDDYAETSRARAKELAFTSELEQPPGTGYLYSDTGYGIAAQVVEIVSGRPFTGYLREQLFAPASMRQTGFYGEKRWDRVTVATGYHNGDDMGSPAERDRPYWGLLGFGGVVSTVDDLHRWSVALSGHTVLKRESVERLFTPHVVEERGGDSFYGYGWVVQESLGIPIVWHDGATEAHNAFLGMLDDEHGTVVAVLSNRIIETSRSEVFFATETGASLVGAIVLDDFQELPAFAK